MADKANKQHVVWSITRDSFFTDLELHLGVTEAEFMSANPRYNDKKKLEELVGSYADGIADALVAFDFGDDFFADILERTLRDEKAGMKAT